MTMQQLRYAIGIADSGAFSKAAERLFVSQPSLTASIRQLEEEVGILIFNRTVHGATLTEEGDAFIAEARQIYAGFDAFKGRYGEGAKRKRKFAVSTQHYSFAVESFIALVRQYDTNDYEFAIREERTRDVIEDVASHRSEIGVLYLSDFNRHVISSLLKSRSLEFVPLVACKAFVYLAKTHPLAKNKSITFEELAPYPCLSFEQGGDTPWAFAEEILSTKEYHRTIKATDRATMFNLMKGLNGYTLCSGIISQSLNGPGYAAVPFRDTDEAVNRTMEIGYVRRTGEGESELAREFVAQMKRCLGVA